jgi:hypothetical protein
MNPLIFDDKTVKDEPIMKTAQDEAEDAFQDFIAERPGVGPMTYTRPAFIAGYLDARKRWTDKTS